MVFIDNPNMHINNNNDLFIRLNTIPTTMDPHSHPHDAAAKKNDADSVSDLVIICKSINAGPRWLMMNPCRILQLINTCFIICISKMLL